MKKIGDTKKANKMAKVVSCLVVFAILMTAVPVIVAASNANGKTGETADLCSACSNRPMPPEGVMSPLASLAPGYCPSSGGSHGYEYILNIVPTINPDRTMIITVNIYIANPSGCTYGNPCPEYDESPEYINAWIDWNGDKTWEPSERVMDEALTGYENINYHGTMTASSIVTIPLDAVETTWMRVNLGWGYDPNDPCEESWSWGDVVDMEIQLDVVTCKVVEIDALKDIKIRDDDGNDIVDPVYKLDDNGNIVKDEPIADYMKSNSFKIKAAVDAFKGGKRTDKPEWTPTVKYSWCTDDRVSICPTCGGGEFDGWSGEFDVILPQSVGQYDVLIEFTFYKDGEQIGDPQRTGPHKLYVTYDKPKLGFLQSPKERWLEVATDWGKGAETAEQVAENVVDKEYSNPFSWIYKDTGEDWEKMIDTTPSDKANCFVFAEVHKKLTRVLGLSSSTATYSPGKSFITSTKEALDNNLDANARNKATGNCDRWHFWCHCVGRFIGKYFDPTFGLSRYTDEEKNVDYKDTGNTVTEGGITYRIYQSPRDPAKKIKVRSTTDFTPNGWRICEYKNPSLQSNSSTGAIFTGNITDSGLDTDGDGLFNYLMVGIEINVAEDDNYSIDTNLKFENTSISVGSLSLGLGIDLSTPNVTLFMNTGIHEITLYFSGRDIYEAGKNGNYTIDAILNRDGQIDAELFNTSFYNYSQFQGLTLDVINMTDFGFDINGDGRFDQLTVKVDFDVRRDAFYEIQGFLLGGGKQIDSASNSSDLTKGTKTVFINFDGSKIRSSRVNGPYNLELFLADENYNKIVFYNTSLYNYTQFEKPSAEFTGVYSDYGTDTDANGVYDYLTTEIEVNVSNPGNYTLLGWLSDNKRSDIIWANNHTYLGIGTHSVLLNFDGTAVYKHGIDGPYNLSYLTLHDENDTPIDLVYAAYNTSAYSYTDFQSPSASFRDTYSDYGVDTNGDGFYEYLTVEVGLDITSAGNYSTHGCLYDIYGNETADTYNLTYLNTGNQIVTLNFGGNSIYKHGVNGSFNLTHLLLYDENGTLVDNMYYAYTTSAYGYTDFQPLIRLTGSYLDYGTDTDDNGLFDNLTVDVGVMLASEGHCIATARLVDSNGEEIVWASNTSWLYADQSQVIQLNFDGKSIYGNMVDGPYYVRDVYVYHTGDPTLSDYVYGAYTTAAYNYTDFEKSGILYYPDFTDTDTPGNWRTWLGVMNTGDTAITVRLDVYNPDGNLAYSNPNFVTLESKAVHFFRPGITAGIGQGSAIVYGDTIAGTCHVNTNGGEGTKVYTALSNASSTLYYPDFTDTDTAGNWRTWIAVMNTEDTSTTLNLTIYNTDGSIAYSNSDFVTLEPKAVHFFRPGITAGIGQGSVAVSGDNLAGTCHVNKNGGEGTKVYTALTSGSSTLYYPDFTDTDTAGNWRTWLGVMNTGDTSATLRLDVYNTDGSLAYSNSDFVTLDPKAVHFFRPGMTAGIAQGSAIVSGNNLAGTCHVNKNGGEGTKVYTALSSGSSTLNYPDFTDTDTSGNWRTWLGVVNTGDTSTTVRLNVYNPDGSLAYSDTEFVTLGPKAVHFFRPGITAGIAQGDVVVSGDNLAGTCHVNRNGGEGTKVYTAIGG